MLAQNNKQPSPEELQDQVSESEHSNSLLDQQEDGNDAANDDATKKIGKWTTKEDDLLRKYVPLFGEKQWRKISEYIPGRTSIQCLHRWTKILKPGLVKGPWTAEEDQKLMAWVKTEGPTKWAQCANFITGRSGKQCRERWFNNLNPDVKKGNWEKQEDELIFGLYQKYGSSWSKIAKMIPGRTENAIKNRFYSTLRKLTSDKKKEQMEKHEDLCLGEEKVVNEPSPQKELIDIANAAQAPNALYLLLNGKTSAVQGQEELKKEISVACVDRNAKTTANQSEKQQQSFNINGEKFVVLRDMKTNEKNIQDATNKLLNTEIEDNDLAFEEFLGNLQLNLKDDYLKKEFEPCEKLEDLSHLDGLQKKILNFCQNNIKDLAESFKLIETNKTSTNTSEISASDLKARLGPQMQTSTMTVESTNIPQETANVKATAIVTPIINAQKGFAMRGNQLPQMNGKSGNSPVKMPSPKGFSLYNPINPVMKLSRNGSENSSDHKSQNAGQIPLKMPPTMGIETDARMSVEKAMNMPFMMGAQPGFPAGFNGFNGFNGNLIGFNQRLPNGEINESEKRLTFLFQQLFSLEMLLAKTRNDLIQYESSMNDGTKKGFNMENIKMEEADLDILRAQQRGLNMPLNMPFNMPFNMPLNMPRPLAQFNSEFDQLMKKRKVE